MSVKWGTPTEVDRSSVPPKHYNSPYEHLFHDIRARLEQTNGTKALAYPFETYEDAKSAGTSISILFSRRICKGCVEVRADGNTDGTGTLYVFRGENYRK